MADNDVLRAPHVLEYPYVRSVGPVIGAFLTALRDGRMLGALDDLSPRAAPVPITVRPYVAVVDRDVTLVLSDEVAAAFWVPVAALAAPGARRDSVVTVRGVERLVPSFRHEEYVVWGMTEHILRELLAELPRLLAVTEGP